MHETIEKLTSEIGKLETKIAETRAANKHWWSATMQRATVVMFKKHLHSSKTNEAMAKFEQFLAKWMN